MDNFIHDHWPVLVLAGVIAGILFTLMEHRFNRKPDKRKTIKRYQSPINRDYKGKK